MENYTDPTRMMYNYTVIDITLITFFVRPHLILITSHFKPSHKLIKSHLKLDSSQLSSTPNESYLIEHLKPYNRTLCVIKYLLKLNQDVLLEGFKIIKWSRVGENGCDLFCCCDIINETRKRE